MIKMTENDAEIYSSSSCGNLSLIGYNVFSDKRVFTKITPNSRLLKKMKNKNFNDIKVFNKNISLEFDLNKYESKSSASNISINNNNNSNNKNQNFFQSKSLNDMSEVLTRSSIKQLNIDFKPPSILKEKMLSIEEFYLQTPEHVNNGRSSRTFETNVHNYDSPDSSDDEIDDKNVKSQDTFQQLSSQPSPQLKTLPVIVEREKIKSRIGILKSTTNTQSKVNETNDLNKSKPKITTQVPRKISTNKLFKAAEVSAQTIDLELNNKVNAAKDKSILANQQSTHSDTARLTYLKRYVANNIANKNGGAKFCNGYWNRLPLKTKPLNIIEHSNQIDNTSTSNTRASNDFNSSIMRQSKPSSIISNQQQLNTINNTIHTNENNNNNNTLPSLQKELSIIDINLPANIQKKPPKGPLPYYKRNVMVYVNNNNNVYNYNTIQHNSVLKPPSATNTNISQKSVTFNNTISIESYTIDPDIQPESLKCNSSNDYYAIPPPSKQILPTNINGNTIDINKLQFRYLNNSSNNNNNNNNLSQPRYRANLEINGKHYYLINDDTNKNYLKKTHEINTPLNSIMTNRQERHIKF